mgnify:FL=1
MSRVSREGFQNRIRYLADQRGVERIARQQGVTVGTVRNWVAGRTAPSNRRRDALRRQALRAGARRAVQIRGPSGRFETTITREESLAAIESAREGSDRQRALARRAAEETGSLEAIQAAEMIPEFSDADAIRIARGLEELNDFGESGRYPGGWRQWERDYESFRSAGGSL